MSQSRTRSVDSLQRKVIRDYRVLRQITQGYRASGSRVVLTIGSWDMLHIGHCRYLKRASEHGDILVVGVDSDQAIRRYKGPMRPVIPQEERMEMLSFLNFVDLIALVEDVDKNGEWQFQLLKDIHPHTFVAVDNSYPLRQRKQIRRYCDRLEVLKRQAERTSSTDVFKNLLIHLPLLIESADRRQV